MDSAETIGRVWFLLWGAVLAAASGLARYLTEKRPMNVSAMVGGILGSGIAAFSFTAFMIESFNVSNLLILAMAGPIGWLGGDVLAAIGKKLMDDDDRKGGGKGKML